jgi:glycine cleavage system aminomethyltransferase T
MDSATPSELLHSPLEALLLKAGATMVARHGWLVAAHYGSPGGELALADTALGLADRSDMGKFELRGDADAVEQLVGQLTGGQVAPGEALAAGGAWWGAVSGEHVVALCGAADTPRLRAALEDAARHTHGATVADATTRLAALGLLGPGARAVLDELSGSGPLDEAIAPTFDVTMLAAVPVMLLRTAPTRAILLTQAARAAELWLDVERAGRGAGLGHVGADAIAHLSPVTGR